MTSDTHPLFLGIPGGFFHPGEPTDPMIEHALEGVSFASRQARDIAHLPTLRTPALAAGALAASRIYETPTRKMTRVIPTPVAAADRPAQRTAPADFYTGTTERAMCGHDTLTPMWDEGHSACPACYAQAHCAAFPCRAVPVWGDRCGYWWCAEHEGGAVLMTLGGDLGYPTMELPEAEGFTIYRARETWLAFARAVCQTRHDLLRAAILGACRARLMRPGEERGPALTEVATNAHEEVRPW